MNTLKCDRDCFSYCFLALSRNGLSSWHYVGTHPVQSCIQIFFTNNHGTLKESHPFLKTNIQMTTIVDESVLSGSNYDETEDFRVIGPDYEG